MVSILLLFISLFLCSCVKKEERVFDDSLIVSHIPCSQCGKVHCECEELLFSLDEGLNWITTNDILLEYEIWEEINVGFRFFYATTYEEFVEEFENSNFDFNDKPNNYPELDWNTLLDIYNEAYFETNNLLFYYKVEGAISENYVYNVVIQDDSLTVNVNRMNGISMALSEWLQLVTLKKSDVQNITEYHVCVRTISYKPSTIEVVIDDQYVQDVYLNGLSEKDFPGLDNLGSISVYTSPINVDIKFNETITPERLADIISILASSENITMVGYTSQQWIRVRIDNKFIVKLRCGTLTLADIISDTIEDSDHFMMEILPGGSFASATLTMEKHGSDRHAHMIEQLKALNYPFINYTHLH